jgi:hypothetical protein
MATQDSNVVSNPQIMYLRIWDGEEGEERGRKGNTYSIEQEEMKKELRGEGVVEHWGQ